MRLVPRGEADDVDAPGRDPGSHVTKEGINDACTLGVKRSGLSKPVTPHSLRHYVSFRSISCEEPKASVFPGFFGHSTKQIRDIIFVQRRIAEKEKPIMGD